MANERKFLAVTQSFATDGTPDGQIRVLTAKGFKVKATVTIQSTTQPPLTVEIKSVPNSTTIEVGPPSSDMQARVDLSAFLVSDGAYVMQPRQDRRSIGPGEMDRATYEEEPTVARRVALVDPFGGLYDENNPLPVTSDAQPNPLTRQSSAVIAVDALTEIFSYTSTSDNTKIVYLESTVSESSLLVVLIDGVPVRQLRTSPLERNAQFEFLVHKPLLNGQTLAVQAQVDRFILSSYDAFTAMEAYVT